MRPSTHVAFFDDSHGQSRWNETGFPSRELHTNLAGIHSLLQEIGYECQATGESGFRTPLSSASLLVLPPPTGVYNATAESWKADRSALLTPQDILAITRFLDQGGSLLAFAYRFGDSFTQSNLSQLFAALGCLLNDDAVVNLDLIQTTHPLQSMLELPVERLFFPGAGVQRVVFRTSATFTLLPRANVVPIAVSPGGPCITFNRTHRLVSFQSLPIGVAGSFGRGRFALFGGPHAFETGPLGLLDTADNTSFLRNILRWLQSGEAPDLQFGAAVWERLVSSDAEARWRQFTQIRDDPDGQRSVRFVERLLRQSGLLKAMRRARWAT